jgi:DNA-binding transcriptional regulator/RsmH inhibitor MraZ
VENEGAPESSAVVEIPRGRYPGRLDDKGRLKLAVPFQKFLSGLPEKTLFCTSLDRRTAVIYPISVWRDNEKFFESFHNDPRAAKLTMFTAQDLGSEIEMDGQGRITLNPDLRRELGLENTGLHMYSEKGHITILTDALYQERRLQSQREAEAALDILERAGMK